MRKKVIKIVKNHDINMPADFITKFNKNTVYLRLVAFKKGITPVDNFNITAILKKKNAIYGTLKNLHNTP